MEKNCVLEKLTNTLVKIKLLFVFTIALLLSSCNNKENVPLKVAISPYQDIAMIVNIKNLELEKKYGTQVDLLTMNWEEILPAISSAGETADIGFGSLNEYLTKYNNINNNSNDPILFIYPAYIFKGGGFITFNDNVPKLTIGNITNKDKVNNFLDKKIGAQKNSIYEMMLYSLANRNEIDIKSLKLYDTPLNDGLLASQNGSVDIASAGLTQISEAVKNNGRVVLTMEDLGFADITGFICKSSTLDTKKKEITDLLKMWFDCVYFVMSDLETNSKWSLEYLNQKAATKYSFEQYKTALSQEYFPTTVAEVNNTILSKEGQYSYERISSEMIDYLISTQVINKRPPIPEFITIK